MVPHVPGRRLLDAQDEIASFCDDVVNSRHKIRTVVRRPLRALRVWHAVQQLDELTCPLDGGESEPFRFVLHRPAPWPIRDLLALRSVLEIPIDDGDYVSGRGRQTLRRKIRIAERAGATAAEVHDPAQRRRLLELTVDREKAHPNITYRNAEPDLGHLLEIDLWLVATSEDGRPLLVAVAPVTGEWSLLSYFRTLEDGDVASATRYLMTAELIERLRQRGVRHLLDPASPFRLPAGLRHFQRMLGWRSTRVRLSRSPSTAAE